MTTTVQVEVRHLDRGDVVIDPLAERSVDWTAPSKHRVVVAFTDGSVAIFGSDDTVAVQR